MSTNPYEPATIEEPSERLRRSEFRALPAAILMFIGVAATVLSGGGIIQSAYLAARGYTFPYLEVFTNLVVVFLFGNVCIAASAFFWQAKYRKGIYTAVAAFAIFAISAAIRS